MIKQKIDQLKREKNELNEILPMQYKIDNEKAEIEKEINEKEIKFELIQEIQKLNNDKKIEEETIKVNEKLKQELEEKVKEEENNLNNIKTKKCDKKSHKKLYIISLLLTAATIIFVILNKIIFISVTLGLAIISLIVALTLNLNENRKFKKIKDEEELETNKISNKIEILENEIREKEKLISEKRDKLNEKINSNILILKNKYSNVNNIEKMINDKIYELSILDEQKHINELKLKITRLEMQKNEIKQKSENASKIEEQLENYEEELNQILEYNDAINLSKESLEKAYTSMRENITPKFAENLSNAIKSISNEKYKKVKVNEEEGLLVETENGNYVPADVLSTGTIDQLYLSLRISSLNELTKENMPIILDETFAYFDKGRLENVLKFLDKEYKDRQILILTCTNREVEALKQLDIKFNRIDL